MQTQKIPPRTFQEAEVTAPVATVTFSPKGSTEDLTISLRETDASSALSASAELIDTGGDLGVPDEAC
jgi:hypothetical protein